jgi:hypothetical protein
MELEDIVLSKINKTDKDKSAVSHLWKVKKEIDLSERSSDTRNWEGCEGCIEDRVRKGWLDLISAPHAYTEMSYEPH